MLLHLFVSGYTISQLALSILESTVRQFLFPNVDEESSKIRYLLDLAYLEKKYLLILYLSYCWILPQTAHTLTSHLEDTAFNYETVSLKNSEGTKFHNLWLHTADSAMFPAIN